ncbi:hypothetical protein SSAG_04096 [Streptomyces sp. Mg1]|nr:hypothetical protein SSAG_04096 [Streptomyces sp. Mg1]
MTEPATDLPDRVTTKTSAVREGGEEAVEQKHRTGTVLRRDESMSRSGRLRRSA